MPPRKRPTYRRPNPLSAVNLRWPIWAALGAVLLFAGAGFATSATLEERDSFCASCHTQPESTYFQRTQVAAVDLASQHHASATTRCIDCHSGPGFTGRAGAIALGARDLTAWVTHTDQQPAPLTVPVSDATCLKCHGDVVTTRNFNRHFHAFLARWQSVDNNAATCVSCHGGHTTDGQANLAFLQADRTQQVCDSCHQSNGGRG
jgi:predicted CXXCH cytochrome family protein